MIRDSESQLCGYVQGSGTTLKSHRPPHNLEKSLRNVTSPLNLWIITVHSYNCPVSFFLVADPCVQYRCDKLS